VINSDHFQTQSFLQLTRILKDVPPNEFNKSALAVFYDCSIGPWRLT